MLLRRAVVWHNFSARPCESHAAHRLLGSMIQRAGKWHDELCELSKWDLILQPSNRMPSSFPVSPSRQLLAAGSIAIGAWGVLAPRQVARLMGDDPALARRLAVRDLIIGVALMRSRGPLALLFRAASDGADALRLRRRSPLTATAALAVGVWSLTTALVEVGRRTSQARP